MPSSKHHKHVDFDDEYRRDRSRGRDQRRPRAQHRSSSYDDTLARRPRPSRSRHYDDFDSEYDSDHASPPPRRRHTRSEGRRRPRSRAGTRIRTRSMSLSRDLEYDEFQRQRKEQAVKSALTAGAVEAIRQRNRPGDWVGERGLRVATAALSAAAIDTAVDKDPGRKGKRNILKSTIGGLVVDRLANGARGRH